MIKTDVISYISELEAIGSDEFNHLSEIGAKQPWFSTIHTLRAKCLSNQNKYGFKQALKKAAIYSGDREVLYDVIHGHIQFNNLGTSSIELVNDDQSPPTKEEKELVETTSKIDSREDSESTTSEEIIEVDETIETSPKEGVLENQSKAVESTLEIDEERDEPAVSESPTETVRPEIESVYDPTIELQKFIQDDAEETREDGSTDQAVVENMQPQEPEPERHNFLDWLDSVGTEDEKDEPKPRPLPMSEEAQRLLDNFIKNRPSIRKIRTTSNTSQPSATYNQNEEESIVSESLARLHVKQGHPEEALKVYEKLQLQNPQKFSYFAALIENLREEFDL